MLIYDGDCGFCRRSLGWARALGGRFEAVPADRVDPASVGLTSEQLRAAAWWVEPDGATYGGHLAIARVLRTSRWWPVRWLGRLVGSRALDPVGRRVYAWVAANRHRFPGRLG